MRKIVALTVVALLTASSSMATYTVVMKDGSRYRAKQKWTITNGKAMIPLENGTTLQVDPSLIDSAASEKVSRSGMAGDIKVLASRSPQPSAEPEKASPLGSITKLRKLPPAPAPGDTPAPPAAAPAPIPGGKGTLGNDVLSKFSAAYENIGIYEKTVSSPAPATLRVQLTADNEDKVFKAISATSYMMVHVPAITGSQIDVVELFMSTTNGGAAGRFQMTRKDADAIDTKAMSLPDYYVRKVLY